MPRLNKLLLLDGLINLVLGIMLLAFPSAMVEFLGVPDVENAFYPNILGAVLFGIAIALFMESGNPNQHTHGLALPGAVVINLCGGLALAAWLVFGDLDLPTRGLVFLWGLVVLLVGISCVELVSRVGASRNA